jgi:hypothetical protein
MDSVRQAAAVRQPDRRGLQAPAEDGPAQLVAAAADTCRLMATCATTTATSSA